VETEYIIPNGHNLYSNYPNPFNSSTIIRYFIEQTNFVQLTIYNNLGKLLRTLVHEEKASGEHSIVWDGEDSEGTNASSGIYLYHLKVGSFVQTRKMILLR
jgi:flagellar hook assembly protein FlgD